MPLLLCRWTCAHRGRETSVGGEESGPGMEFCIRGLLGSSVAVSDLEPGTNSKPLPPTSCLRFLLQLCCKAQLRGPPDLKPSLGWETESQLLRLLPECFIHVSVTKLITVP